MVSKELLGDFSRHLALKAREQQFCREVWRLMEDLKDKVVPTLNEYVDDAKIAYHWGRIGVECNVKDVVNTRAWVFFGAYLDPSDHGIAQRNENEPDFAIFIDVNPQQRKSLIGAGLDVEIARMLTEVGFKLNFPDNACGNPWRMAYWQVPMRECLDDQPAELAEMFVARLRPLFSSGVLQKIAVDVG